MKRLKYVGLGQREVGLLMAKSKRTKELEKEYETVTLILGPKGKSGVQISSVPIKKLKALNEWRQKMHACIICARLPSSIST